MAELDFLKGVLILLMVAFHLVYVGQQHPYAKQIVYTFHMPAFLLISGYLMRVDKPWRQFLKTIGWFAVPYLVMESGYIVMASMLPINEHIDHLTAAVFFDKLLLHPLGPYWYLQALIVCGLVYYAVWQGGRRSPLSCGDGRRSPLPCRDGRRSPLPCRGGDGGGVSIFSTDKKLKSPPLAEDCSMKTQSPLEGRGAAAGAPPLAPLFLLMALLCSLCWVLAGAPALSSILFFLGGALLRQCNVRFTRFFQPTLLAIVPFALLACYPSNLHQPTLGGVIMVWLAVSMLLAVFPFVRGKVRSALLYVGRLTLPIFLFSPIFTILCKQLVPWLAFDPTALLFTIVSVAFCVAGSLMITKLMDLLHLSPWFFGRRQMVKKFSLTALLVLFAMTGGAQNDLKPRLVVCTDIAPADVEPDDMESMVRLMAYADCFEIEALITSVGWNCDPYPVEWAEYLQRVIEAYRQDVPNLMRRSGQSEFLPLKEENGQQHLGYWPSADYLKSRAVMGSIHGGIKAIGSDNDSPGSQLLIRLADEDDPRPIYVAAWGGANTLAQAIWRVNQTRNVDEVSAFVKKFRLFTITDQDMQYSMRMDRAYSSHMWLRKDFQDDLQFIWDEGAWQEQCELGKRHWQQHQNMIQGKGALGKEYPSYKWGVEGDTPSFLYVMPHGLNNPEDPHQCGWAGYHERGLCADSLTMAWTSWQEPVRSISVAYKQRFYPDELNDFCARMQWAAEGRGNLNPYIVLSPQVEFVPPLTLAGASVAMPNDTITITIPSRVGKGERPTSQGERPSSDGKRPSSDAFTIRLDASKSFDPDGDALSFRWWQQPEIGTTKVAIDQSDQAIATLRIPADTKSDTIHLICEVHDDGPFHLVAYRRLIIAIKR